jgi:hypothetical protein
VRIVKNCVRCNGELVVTIFAIEELADVHEPRRIRIQAARACRAIGPAKTLQKFAAKVIRCEGSAKVDNGHRETSNG